jgi:two-component system, NtrC family, response regulator HydG
MSSGKGLPLVAAVDDDVALLELWKRVLARDYELQTFADPLVALNTFKTKHFDAVLLDLHMPGMDGLTLLGHLKQLHPTTEAIVVTAGGTVQNAVEALKMGAFDFLTKPLDDISIATNRLRSACERKHLREVNTSLADKVRALGPDTLLIGESGAMRKVRELVAKIASSDATVLINGESGTGKELVARALQAASPRKEQPFITLNCAAISETLIDSELFGHERGAFTGAVTAHRGLFEAADGGTLFLDELGELPGETQAKLLRALQEGEIRAVGSTKAKKVNVRVIAATNVDLEKAIKAGEFREDLYYRINTFRIVVPPLRDRLDDVPVLAQHLLSRFCKRTERKLAGFTDECLHTMMSYTWPGNVRQLGNAVEYAATLATGERVEAGELPNFVIAKRAAAPVVGATETGASGVAYSEARARTIDEFDIRYLTDLMTAAKGNISEASRRSGIDRANLRRMLTRLDLDHLRRQT